MIYGSVCSGIEAATVAWHPLGWRAAFYAEIDAFPCALLSHYYSTPNHGDMTKFAEWPDADIDVLVGGTPCQAFSIAGLRKGLADPRGNLTLTYLALAGRYRPRWILWENVPGVLSQDGGRAFGSFLGGLAELGYGWAYRIMDAQYFDLAQRRPRVFVVASARGWASAAAVLFERESLQGHPAPSREQGKDVAPAFAARTSGGGGQGTDFDLDGGLIAMPLRAQGQHSHREDSDTVIVGAITARFGGQAMGAPEVDAGLYIAVHALTGEGCDASEDGTGRGTPIIAAPLSAGNNANSNAAGRRREDDENLVLAFNARQDPDSGPVTHPLDTDGCSIAVTQAMGVRRLTPRECERLQGFHDDYTLIPYNGKPAKDTPRYKALGNSMAVPVMRWLAERIELVDNAALELAA